MDAGDPSSKDFEPPRDQPSGARNDALPQGTFSNPPVSPPSETFIIPIWDIRKSPHRPVFFIPIVPSDFPRSAVTDPDLYTYVGFDKLEDGRLDIDEKAFAETRQENDPDYRHGFDYSLFPENIGIINPNLPDGSLEGEVDDVGKEDKLDSYETEIEEDESDRNPVHPQAKKKKSKRVMMKDAREHLSTRLPYKITDARRFAWSLIVEGARFEQQDRFLQWNDIDAPSKWAVYNALDSVCDGLVAMAMESCAKWRGLMADESAIGFDGSWSQRRNANHCFGAFVDPIQRKVVDFDTFSRGFGDYTVFAGDYEGTSKAMECEILRVLVHRWSDEPKVKYFVHDQDSSAMAILRQEGWKLEEKFDQNHVIKSWKAHFRRMRWIPVNQPGEKLRQRDVLRGLQLPLLKWFYTVLKLDVGIGGKMKA
jgi:hypothetical protein